MKIKILCAIALLSTSVFANDPAVPEQMMRGRSSQYQDGFRDGFREAVRMMNSSNNNWNNGGGGPQCMARMRGRAILPIDSHVP